LQNSFTGAIHKDWRSNSFEALLCGLPKQVGAYQKED
jgi:hypothetical protein